MSRPSFYTQRIYDLVRIIGHRHYYKTIVLSVKSAVLRSYRRIQERKRSSSLGRLYCGEWGDGIMTEEVVFTCMVPRPAATAPWEHVRNVNSQSPPSNC